MAAKHVSDIEATALIREYLDSEDLTVVASFTVHGEPRSKARPRFTKTGRTYTPATTRAAEDEIKAAYLNVARRIETDVDSAFRVEATFASATRQRRDVDNMLKLILDALNGVAWPDDTQVLEVSGTKSFVDKSRARTEVTVFKIKGGMAPPTQACVRCGTHFRTYASWQSNPTGKKYCTPDCFHEDMKGRRKRTCATCGKDFYGRAHRTGTRFCSRDCANAYGRTETTCPTCGDTFEVPKSWQQDRPCCSEVCQAERDRTLRAKRKSKSLPGTCQDCGAGTTRKEYTRCRPCSAAARRSAS